MIYLVRGTSGDFDATNLQIYSLKQAADRWNELVEDLKGGRYSEPDGELTERVAFIVVCLGLSLSQLLGQNFSDSSKLRVNSPAKLLRALLDAAEIGESEEGRLVSTFDDFLTFYDAIRHFGKSKDQTKYRMLDELTLERLEEYRRMTIRIWDLVLEIFRVDADNRIDFDSIADAVEFEPLPSGQDW